MRRWLSPRRLLRWRNDDDDHGVDAGGSGQHRRLCRSTSRIASSDAGVGTTIVDSHDETTNVARIIYDIDAMHDAIEVVASSSDEYDDAMTENTTCTPSSWEEGEEEGEDGVMVVAPNGAVGATNWENAASCESHSCAFRDARDIGAHANDSQSGVSPPEVAIAIDRRRGLLPAVTPMSAITRKGRRLMYPRRGGMRRGQSSS